MNNSNNYKTKKLLFTIFIYVVLIIGAIITLLPFYWMFITSFMTYRQSISPNPDWFYIFKPWEWEFSNYAQAFSLSVEKSLQPMMQFRNSARDTVGAFWAAITFQKVDARGFTYATFGTFMFNTVFTTVINTVLTIFTTVLGAFALAKIPFRGKNRLFAIFLSTMMVPGEMLLITNLITIMQLQWMDTYYALIVPFTASVFYIYLLRQFFMQIPDSLYKAARVDGCSDWKFLWRVMVPMSKNTLITVAVLNAIASWNAYLWPLMVTSKPKMFVLSVGLVKFNEALSEQFTPPAQNLIMAGSSLVIVPMIILYVLLRKQIISGVTRSGTKG